jgi:hypothetical protein
MPKNDKKNILSLIYGCTMLYLLALYVHQKGHLWAQVTRCAHHGGHQLHGVCQRSTDTEVANGHRLLGTTGSYTHICHICHICHIITQKNKKTPQKAPVFSDPNWIICMWTMWVTTYCEAWKIDENRTKWPYISKWLIWIAQWCSLLQLEDPPRWSNWQCHCYGQWGKCSRALDLDVKPWLKTGPSPMCSCKMKTFFGPWPSYPKLLS